jgi:hypothetical protein
VGKLAPSARDDSGCTPWHHEEVDTFSDYDLLWQLGTAVVLIGALIFLVLAYRRRHDRD